MVPSLQPIPPTERSENLQCTVALAKRKRPHFGCALVSVSGEIVHPKQDARFIRWRIEEAFDLEFPSDALLLDLSALRGPNLSASELLPPLIRRRQLPVRVLCPPPSGPAADWPEEERSIHLRRGLQALDAFDPQPTDMKISDLAITSYTWSGEGLRHPGLAISISGTYGHGSDGRDDARLIHWRMSQFQEQIQPFGVVVDLRDFHYEWGDDLSPYPPGFYEAESPIRFVVRPDSITALAYAIEEAHMTIDEELAYTRVQSIGQARAPNAP